MDANGVISRLKGGSGRGVDHDAYALSHLPAVQAGVLVDTWGMNLRHTPWWLIIVGFAHL